MNLNELIKSVRFGKVVITIHEGNVVKTELLMPIPILSTLDDTVDLLSTTSIRFTLDGNVIYNQSDN